MTNFNLLITLVSINTAILVTFAGVVTYLGFVTYRAKEMVNSFVTVEVTPIKSIKKK